MTERYSDLTENSSSTQSRVPRGKGFVLSFRFVSNTKDLEGAGITATITAQHKGHFTDKNKKVNLLREVNSLIGSNPWEVQ